MENKQLNMTNAERYQELFEHEATEVLTALKDELKKVEKLGLECEKIDEVLPKNVSAKFSDSSVKVDVKPADSRNIDGAKFSEPPVKIDVKPADSRNIDGAKFSEPPVKIDAKPADSQNIDVSELSCSEVKIDVAVSESKSLSEKCLVTDMPNVDISWFKGTGSDEVMSKILSVEKQISDSFIVIDNERIAEIKIMNFESPNISSSLADIFESYKKEFHRSSDTVQ